MTANKKNTSKAAKSPAPATKAQKSTSKSAAKKPATSAPLAATTPAVIAAPAPAPVTTAIRVAPPVSIAVATPPVTAVAPKPLVTTINARIDVGFGNALYLRGEGAGLSWDKGLLMTCVGPDQWQVTLPESSRPVLFKFLINDLTWSLGADSVVAPGTTSTFTPEF